MKKIGTAIRIARTYGPGGTLRYAKRKVLDAYYERLLRINTSNGASLHELGIADTDAVEYAPTSYSVFFSIAKRVDLTGRTFVDYGCGAGRIVCCAGRLSARKVIGLELSRSMVQKAAANVAIAKPRLACKDIEIVCGNAAEWPVPPAADVFHFYNPFNGETLKRVVTNIAASLREHPRKAWILYGLPRYMDPIMRSGEVIPLGWQKERLDVMWPPYREETAPGPYAQRHRVYRLDSRVLTN